MPSENRIINAVVGQPKQEVKGSNANLIQDQCGFLLPCTEEQGGLVSTVEGAYWRSGEYSIVSGMPGAGDKLLDDGHDWRNRIIEVTLVNCAAANILPSGAAHVPPAVADVAHIVFDTRGGDPIGAPNLFAWVPFVGVALYLYAEDANGHLYLSNASGVVRYIYLTALYTPRLT